MVRKIFVVEDDQDLLVYLKELLQDKGFSVDTASDGATALNMLKKIEPDLVVLDFGLPNISGETVCLEIKKKNPQLPVIILTAKDTTNDIVHGLDIGADDYIAKPFESEELIARINARLRKTAGEDTTIVKVDDLELDSKTFKVKRAEKSISLTPKEFQLLHYLISNKGRILTREVILNRVWLYSPEVDTRVVDVYMGYLRKKIDASFKKKLLHSARGFGYMIKE